MKKKVIAILLSVTMLFTFTPIYANAASSDAEAAAEPASTVSVLFKPSDNRFYEMWGIYCQGFGGGYNKAYFGGTTMPKDRMVFHWVRMINDLFFSSKTFTYDEWMAMVDRSFYVHSDLKAYLKANSGKAGFTYNEGAGTIKLSPIGGSGGYDYTLKIVKKQLNSNLTGYVLCKWMKGKTFKEYALLHFKKGAVDSFKRTSSAVIPSNTVKSKFALGKDNNSFAHWLDKTYKKAGFVGVQNYSISSNYYKTLTKGLSKKGKQELDQTIADKFGGACYGIAATMALVYDKNLSVKDISSYNSGTYYSMALPCSDKRLLNNILYCYLCSTIKGKGSATEAALAQFWSMNAARAGVKYIFGGSLENNTPSRFLEKLVPETKAAAAANKILMLAYNDHCIVVTGYGYDEDNDEHIIYVYDENTSGFEEIGAKAHFDEIRVAQDCSSAHFNFHGKNYKMNDWLNDAGIINVSNMVLIDPAKVGYYKAHGGTSSIASAGEEGDGLAVIKYAEGSAFSITNGEGETLNVNPIDVAAEQGTFSGDMEIEDLYVNLEGDRNYIQLYVNSSDSFTIDGIDSIATKEELYGSGDRTYDENTIMVNDQEAALDVSVSNEGNYTALKTTDIESAEFDSDGTLTIEPLEESGVANTYTFDAYVPMTGERVAAMDVTGWANGEIVLYAEENVVTVDGDDEKTLEVSNVDCVAEGKSVSAEAMMHNESDCEIDGTEALQKIDIVQLDNEEVKLSAESMKYSGKELKPTVTVDGLDAGDYDVSYTDNKNVGRATVTVTGNGAKCEGSATAIFKITPKNTSIKKLVKAKKAFTVKWKKMSSKMAASRITGYQIRYSTKSSMASAKTVTVKGYAKTSKKVTKLKAKKKYYVQIRTYMTVNGETFYSAWSGKKAVKVK